MIVGSVVEFYESFFSDGLCNEVALLTGCGRFFVLPEQGTCSRLEVISLVNDLNIFKL